MGNSVKIIIEITDTHIKWLQGKHQRGRFVVSSAVIKKLKGDSPEFIAEELSRLLSDQTTEKNASPQKLFPPRQAGNSGTKDLVESAEDILVLPRRSVTVKQVVLPSDVDEEIRRMVDLQMTQYIPYGREEIVFDFSLVGKEPGGYTKILAVFVHRDKVQSFLNILGKTGLYPQQCGISSTGIVNWFLHRKEDTSANPHPACLVNVDETSSEICFCHQGKLLFSRHIPLGHQDLRADALENFVQQIGLTIGAYRKETMGDSIHEIFVIATSPQAVRLKEKLEAYYQTPVGLLSPLEDLSSERNFDMQTLREQEGVSIAEVLGFLVESPAPSMNLIPADVQSTKRSRLRRRIIFRTIFLSIVIIIACSAVWGMNTYKDYMYLQKLQGRIEQMKKGINETEKRMQSLGLFRDQIQNQVFMADIIKELYLLTPAEAAFYSLSLDATGALTIQGFANDKGGSINQFQSQLVGSSLFKEVTLQYATKRRRGSEEYTDFKITCASTPNEKSKP